MVFLIPALSPLGLFGILIVVVLFVLAVGALWWSLNKLIAAFELTDPIATVLKVIFVLVCLGALLWFLISSLGWLH